MNVRGRRQTAARRPSWKILVLGAAVVIGGVQVLRDRATGPRRTFAAAPTTAEAAEKRHAELERLRATVLVDGRVRVPAFAQRILTRDQAREVLGEGECGRYFAGIPAPFEGSQSCTHRTASGRRVVLTYFKTADGEVLGHISMLDVEDLPFSAEAVRQFGVSADAAAEKSGNRLRWKWDAPFFRAEVNRGPDDRVQSVSFDLRPTQDTRFFAGNQ